MCSSTTYRISGCRSYTFISTMGLAMEAAAENKIPFVVLDRPNPSGVRMEGTWWQRGSSLSSASIRPVCLWPHCGELARYLNDEGLLAGGARCSLTVIPMKGMETGDDIQ